MGRCDLLDWMIPTALPPTTVGTVLHGESQELIGA